MAGYWLAGPLQAKNPPSVWGKNTDDRLRVEQTLLGIVSCLKLNEWRNLAEHNIRRSLMCRLGDFYQLKDTTARRQSVTIRI